MIQIPEPVPGRLQRARVGGPPAVRHDVRAVQLSGARADDGGLADLSVAALRAAGAGGGGVCGGSGTDGAASGGAFARRRHHASPQRMSRHRYDIRAHFVCTD